VLAPASVLKAPSWTPKPVVPGLAGVAAAGREAVVVARPGGTAAGPGPAGVPGRGGTAPPLAVAAAAHALEGGAAAADGDPLLDAPCPAPVGLLDALPRGAGEFAGVAASPGEARP
jgi:hypothetical protein